MNVTEPADTPVSRHAASKSPSPAAESARESGGDRHRRSLGDWARLLLTPILAVVAIGVGLGIFVSLARLKELPAQVEPQPRVFRVAVYKAESVDVRPFVSTFGTPRPDQEVIVSAEVAGRIVESGRLDVGVHVSGPPDASDPAEPAQQSAEPSATNGSDVVDADSARRGDLLVRIDPDEYSERLAQTRAVLAEFDAAMANTRELIEQKRQSLASARKSLELQQSLEAQKAGRKTDLIRAELDYQLQEAAVLQLQTELNLEPAKRDRLLRDIELAQLNVNKASVHAPFSGVISEAMVEDGQYVRPGEPLFKLTNLDRVEIPLPLPVSQSAAIAGLIAKGEQPLVQLAEHESAECRWVGSVTRIAPTADELTRTIQVYAEVDNSQLADPLRPGTFVNARIESAERRGVLLVPRDALVDGAVYVARAESTANFDGATTSQPVAARAERREVTISGVLQSFAIVTAGLEPGDRVVLTNLDVLQPESLLEVISQSNVHTELDRAVIPGFDVLSTSSVAGGAVGPAN
ncbi:MAG: efflux RND transporter periplasmic adaptor subunit [Planctomycetaceae bacterium]